MVIRLLFHLESNIMMTLKLDMKHICKKEVRTGKGGLFGHGWGLWEARGGGSAPTQRRVGRELRASLRRGSRCRDRIAPR